MANNMIKLGINVIITVEKKDGESLTNIVSIREEELQTYYDFLKELESFEESALNSSELFIALMAYGLLPETKYNPIEKINSIEIFRVSSLIV